MESSSDDREYEMTQVEDIAKSAYVTRIRNLIGASSSKASLLKVEDIEQLRKIKIGMELYHHFESNGVNWNKLSQSKVDNILQEAAIVVTKRIYEMVDVAELQFQSNLTKHREIKNV